MLSFELQDMSNAVQHGERRQHGEPAALMGLQVWTNEDGGMERLAGRRVPQVAGAATPSCLFVCDDDRAFARIVLSELPALIHRRCDRCMPDDFKMHAGIVPLSSHLRCHAYSL